jgi:hypothetical protein
MTVQQTAKATSNPMSEQEKVCASDDLVLCHESATTELCMPSLSTGEGSQSQFLPKRKICDEIHRGRRPQYKYGDSLHLLARTYKSWAVDLKRSKRGLNDVLLLL